MILWQISFRLISNQKRRGNASPFSYNFKPLPFFISSVSRSAIMAMNSLLVGFPLVLLTVYPKYFWRVSRSPRSHATSMAWRIYCLVHRYNMLEFIGLLALLYDVYRHGSIPIKAHHLVTLTPAIYPIIYSMNNSDKNWAEGKSILSALFAFGCCVIPAHSFLVPLF